MCDRHMQRDLVCYGGEFDEVKEDISNRLIRIYEITAYRHFKRVDKKVVETHKGQRILYLGNNNFYTN